MGVGRLRESRRVVSWWKVGVIVGCVVVVGLAVADYRRAVKRVGTLEREIEEVRERERERARAEVEMAKRMAKVREEVKGVVEGAKDGGCDEALAVIRRYLAR